MPNYQNLSKELQERIKEDRAHHWENPYAFRDENVVRRRPSHDKANLWRPAFVRDTEKIMHIPFYNRYADKTQVFSFYKNDDISRRSQHVQLVSRIARNIGRVLGLNLDLIETISLGHDIGHTPFGHAGEAILNDLYHGRTGRYFAHNIQSARVLDVIFPLNLSLETLDGIICHNGETELKEYQPKAYADFDVFDQRVERCYLDRKENEKLIPATLEACVMRISDIIAYLGKDRQDAEKLKIFSEKPVYMDGKIGNTNAEIINNMIVNILENSYGKNYIGMDEEYFQAFSIGKEENYRMIYDNPKIREVFEKQIRPMFEVVYEKLLTDILEGNRDSVVYKHHIDYIREQTKYYAVTDYATQKPDDIVVDYLASMTDDYFIDLYHYLFPRGRYHVDYVGYFSGIGKKD